MEEDRGSWFGIRNAFGARDLEIAARAVLVIQGRLPGAGFDGRDFPSLERQRELSRRRLELQLDRSPRVVLNPELDQERRDPLPYRKEAMDLGAAGGAQRC